MRKSWVILLSCLIIHNAMALSKRSRVAPIQDPHARLLTAIHNPEYVLNHWIDLPVSPGSPSHPTRQLSLHEAILLALRYNPNIQSAELNRIIQRYQLRLAQNEFELQYALAGTAQATNAHYSGIGNGVTRSYLATPEFNYKSPLGTQASLKLDNNLQTDGNYNPLLGLTVKQPLLRGFGKHINEAKLRNAEDAERLNKLTLRQAITDQITQVITAYRALILSGNQLQIQRRQLEEAHATYEANKKKIAAGQLEPTANIQQLYQIESLNLMTEQADNAFANAAQNLLQTIGLDPDMRLAVPSDVTLDTLDIPNVETSIATALTHNTQYLALQMVLRADERAYDVAKNQQLWMLDVSANILAGTTTNVDTTQPNLNNIYAGNNITEVAAVTLTIPLADISRRAGLINAKVQVEKDRINLIAAKRALITTIKNTITTISSLAKRYELAQRQVTLAAESYQLEKKKLAAGIASALDVNNTQNQWIQAQMGLISAKIAYLDQIAALQRLLGSTLDEWHITLRYAG